MTPDVLGSVLQVLGILLTSMFLVRAWCLTSLRSTGTLSGGPAPMQRWFHLVVDGAAAYVGRAAAPAAAVTAIAAAVVGGIVRLLGAW